MPAFDLTNRRFGRLVALRVVYQGRVRCWECRCDCGNTVTVPTFQLTRGDNTSCTRCPREDLSGQTFARLTVLAPVPERPHGPWYRCRCLCGQEVVVRGPKLKTGHTRSCGCLRKGTPQLKHRAPAGHALQNSIRDAYRQSARRRNLIFSLSDGAFTRLIAGNCHYCGSPPTTVIRSSWAAFAYNGIDRLDNTQGYVPGNVVSCCAPCNYKKGAQPYAAFLAWLRTVALYRGLGAHPPGDPTLRLPPCPTCAAGLHCAADGTHVRCLHCGWDVRLDPSAAAAFLDALHGRSDRPLDSFWWLPATDS